MPRGVLSPRNLCYAAALAIVLIGLCSAAWIYWKAGNAEDEAQVYAYAEGNVYMVDPADSKMYRHELERFGGKAAVFADDLNRWFSALWEGRRLAFMVAAISILLALGFYRAGKNCGASSNNDTR